VVLLVLVCSRCTTRSSRCSSARSTLVDLVKALTSRHVPIIDFSRYLSICSSRCLYVPTYISVVCPLLVASSLRKIGRTTIIGIWSFLLSVNDSVLGPLSITIW
jgi:hypothetical protein